MDFSAIKDSALVLFYGIGAAIGAIVLYFTWKVQRVKYKYVVVEHDIATMQREAMAVEADIRRAVLEKTSQMTTEISQSISQKLIDNPSWLDRFMDETGITYSASVFGKRIGHFFHEKRQIAKSAIERVDEYLRKDSTARYCLLIDSGTTLYPVFEEITKRMRAGATKDAWRERVSIVTNNIPGVQYLMKHAKEHAEDDYSEIAIRCFIIPGKPLSVYAAITGQESTKWLSQLSRFLESKDMTDGSILGLVPPAKTKVLGFVTGNYIACRTDGKSRCYYPVARGEGHVEVKQAMIAVSDEVFLLAPLMKFTFASVELLNSVNGFDISRHDHANAKRSPNRVMYEPVHVPEKKDCVFVTTLRGKTARFCGFSEELYHELLNQYGQANVIMNVCDPPYVSQSAESNLHIELKREIPHDTLREKYELGNNIWDWVWVLQEEAKLKASHHEGAETTSNSDQVPSHR